MKSYKPNRYADHSAQYQADFVRWFNASNFLSNEYAIKSIAAYAMFMGGRGINDQIFREWHMLDNPERLGRGRLAPRAE
jgi:hypothetical protein